MASDTKVIDRGYIQEIDIEGLELFCGKEYKDKIQVIEFPLNKDFASFKNNLKDHCSGDYIFQIDADEYPDEYLMDTI